MEAEALAGIREIRKYARRTLALAGAADRYVNLDEVADTLGLRISDLAIEAHDMPSSLRTAYKSIKSKVLGLLSIPDKRIYIDTNQTDTRQRFTKAHEIGHDVLAWHGAAFYHEDSATLDLATRDELEREANSFAGELLFGAGRFTEEADGFAPGLSVPLMLAPQYGASAAATFRYYTEWSQKRVAVIGFSKFDDARGPQPVIPVFPSQCFGSQSFISKFGHPALLIPAGVATARNGLFHLLRESVSVGSGATGEVRLKTRSGTTALQAEVFNNGRLRYVLLSERPTRLSGRRAELVDVAGRPLMRSI